MQQQQHDKKRETFDCIAYHILSYLGSLEHVVDTKFDAEQGLSKHEFVMWEKINFPYKLPADLRQLYELFNGFTLTWGTECAGRKTGVGVMRFNSIKDFVRLPLDSADAIQIEQRGGQGSGGKSVAAFLLDSGPRIGRVAIVFRAAKPAGTSESATSLAAIPSSAFNYTHQIWLQDFSCEWQFICESFTNYFRLMIMHLGIVGWQNAYSSAGLDPVTQQWMRLFCPERLAIDEAARSNVDQLSEERDGSNQRPEPSINPPLMLSGCGSPRLRTAVSQQGSW